MRVPADDFVRSPRPHRGLGELEYPFHDWTAIVTTCGRICYENRRVPWLLDDETCRLQPIENPFQPRVLPMSPE